MAEFVNIFSNPYKTTESWSAQGAVVNYGTGSILNDQGVPIFSVSTMLGNNASKAKKCPLIISGINLTYARQMQQIYPINTDGDGGATKVVIKGAPQGTMSITSIYSPVAKSITEFLQAVSKDCVTKGNSVWVSLRPFGDIKCTTATGQAKTKTYDIVWLLGSVELDQLGLQMQSGPTTIVQMPLTFSFTSLLIGDQAKTS